MQNMLNEPVFLHKDLKIIKGNNEDLSFGKVKSITKNSKNLISGIIHSSTQFQFKSISGSLYYLVEISKETYDFSFNENQTKFETIIKFFKTTVSALKERGSVHQINIIFFTRIYFSKDCYSNLIKKFDKIPSFISFSSYGEFFFDFYTNVLTINNIANINPNKIESDIINKLHRAFLQFAVGFKCKNLNSYIRNISSEYETNFGIFKKDSFSNSPPTFPYSTLFENIENFRIMKSNFSNFFECINVVLKEIRLEKINLSKLGSLITVVSSGEYFPYYNKELSKFTKYNLYEIGIPLFYIIFSTKKNLFNQSKQSIKKYNTISEEYNRSPPTEHYSSLNIGKSNFYDSPISNREYLTNNPRFREVYVYEPDQDDHLVRNWLKILYINYPFEIHHYLSSENIKLFNKKALMKEFVEIENEIFNAKKIENIQQLKKKPKSPKLNMYFKGISEKMSDDFSLAVNDSSKCSEICKDQGIDTRTERVHTKENQIEDGNINALEDLSLIKNEKTNITSGRRHSISNVSIDEIKEKLCNYSRKTPLQEKDQSFVILTNEYDRETFNYKKIMPSINSHLNLKSTEDQCVNQRVNFLSYRGCFSFYYK
jgi:hypothetical protein